MTTIRLRQSWQRLLHATVEHLTLMSAAEQSRLSWAKSIRTAAEIPEAYKDYLQAHLPGPSDWLPAVLTPTFRGFLRRENEKLVFSHAERLYILELAPAGLLPVVFPFAGINYVEVGGILLKSWVKLNGLIDGQLVSATLKYNSVTQHLFDPLVAQIRFALCSAERSQLLGETQPDQAPFALSAAERSRRAGETQPDQAPFALSAAKRSRRASETQPDQAPFALSAAERSRRAGETQQDQGPFVLSEAERSRRASVPPQGQSATDPNLSSLRIEQAKFDPLRDRHFKFMNYARRSLQPGERVVAYTVQPELRQPVKTVLGKPLSMRTLGTAHLCILTDSELIVIRDDPSSLRDYNHSRYGGIWDFLPLSRILDAAIEERPAGHLALVIHLPGSDRMEVLFSTDKRPELEQVCARIETVSPTP